MTLPWLHPTIITGNNVSLLPLEPSHKNALIRAVNDGHIWKNHYAEVPSPKKMGEAIDKRLNHFERGEMLPFSVFDKQRERLVGMTSFCRVDDVNKRTDIGWTWYAKSAQRTAINTEAKTLLLTHAFVEKEAIAVGFRVDALNRPSQQAVLRLGAKLDGVIRNYSRLADGNIRDMHFYSITCFEWPHIKAHLQGLLDQQTAND